jgi:oligopeptide/dipeptide ABC transporter ATP-binding protein
VTAANIPPGAAPPAVPSPARGRHASVAAERPLVVAEHVTKHFPVTGGGLFGKREVVHAIDDVSLTIREGEVMGLVGETGSGKSTFARLILKLIVADSGRITFDGQDVLAAHGGGLKALRRQMQIIFQDPFSALDPSMRLGQSIEAPLSQHGIGDKASRKRMVAELLDKVGLPASFAERYPSECSGGQLHRVVIARALSLGPRFLACDEPTSSLDASIRAQILNLLVDLRDQLGLTLLLISHDLRVVRYISDRVAVMYLGRIVEVGTREEIFEHPLHPYTQKLIAASMPERAGESFGLLQGEPPSPINPPSGCRFRERCPLAVEACKELPPFEEARPGHAVACIRWQDAAAQW